MTAQIAHRAIRKRLGELLIERGIINSEQLKEALKIQSEKGGYLSQHLISLGWVKEVDIARCLSVQYNFGYLSLDDYKMPSYVKDAIPLKMMKIFSVLPVEKSANLLTVAMADPLNEGVIDVMRRVTNCDIEVLVATYGELNRAIERYFAEEIKEIDKSSITEEDLLKEEVVQVFIRTKGFTEGEKRKYDRINIELDMEYFFYGKIFKGRVKNISLSGIYFTCNSFMAVDTNVLCKIYLHDEPVDVVVRVVRVQRINEPHNAAETPDDTFGTAGYFNFLTHDDKRKLILFLKDKKENSC